MLSIPLFQACRDDTAKRNQPASSNPSVSPDAQVAQAVSADTSDPLSVEMRAALARLAPDIVIWNRDGFSDDVRKEARDTGQYGLSVVRGDFNGDGRVDAAVMGHGKDNAYLAAVLSTSTLYHAQWLESPVSLSSRNTSAFLRLQPAGRVEIPDAMGGSPTILRLTNPGIEVAYGQEAGILYYWDKGGFKKIASGD